MIKERPAVRADFALLVLLAALWGGSYSFIKVGVATIPPITLIAGRTLIAGLLLLALLGWRGISLPSDAATWRRFLVQACLNSVLPFTLIAWAELRIDAGLAVILNATTPIFTFLLTLVASRHEAVTGRKAMGVLCGLFGTCLIVGMEALNGTGDAVWPQLAVVLATVCYAAAAIFGKRFAGMDPMLPAAGSLICGAALLLPVSLMVDRPWNLQPSAASLAALLALSIFSTALAFVIYFRLVAVLGSVGVTAQGYLRVPIGAAIGVLLLGETLASTAWAGLACVLAGVIAMTLPARRVAAA
ncbi:EamA family transporter [Niveispirillum sp. SYP-B3756]|uniref:DMT family transporter n=1 Tax=Niveispirillum sp. SYP-B3756 TaxID=2662178 RepID=UPI0012918F39|nr:EamA family transporter [Niveispirillum sp. SYP-B3756]MQP67656.1 EamA family transporter [Niveispirillum sp. SYP-B3756]